MRSLPRFTALVIAALAIAACHDSTAVQTPVGVEIATGNAQTGTVGAALAIPLAVVAADANNRAIPNVTVTWAATGGNGASITPTTSSTGANSVATATLTLGTVSGTYGATATVNGVTTPAIFTATAHAAAASTVTKVGGNAQTGTAGTALGTTFTVVVKDGFGNGVPSATVSWAATGGNGASIAATSTTNANGNATATLTLGTVVGAYGATASVAGVATPATFAATASAGAPASVTKVSGDAQTGTVGAALGTTFTVVVKDALGNVVPSATVNWAATGGNGASIGATSTTNASGNATATLTLGTVPGAYGATASLTGVATTTAFSATANPGAPSTITKIAGDGQTGTVATTLGTAFTAQVKDQYGNKVATGTTVTWTVSAGGSGAPPTSTTDANGQASTTVTLGTVSGAQTVIATAGGASVTFNTTNNPGPIAGMIKVSGDNETVPVGVVPPIELAISPVDAYGNIAPSPGAGGALNLAGVTGMHYNLSTLRNDAAGLGISLTAPTAPGISTFTWSLTFGAAGPYLVTFTETAVPPFVSSNGATRGATPAPGRGESGQLRIVAPR